MISRTALVVVDMQYIHVHPDKSVSGRDMPAEDKDLMRERMYGVQIPAIAALLKAWRGSGGPVIHIVFNHVAPDASDLDPAIYASFVKSGDDVSQWPIRTAANPLSSIIQEVAPLAGEIVLQKTTYSAFQSTNLDFVLKNHGIESLLVVGGLTGCCVMHTAIDAKERGYAIYTVPDACIDRSSERHEAALRKTGYDEMLSLAEALATVREQPYPQ